jgi:hypothetical protein
MLPRGSLGDAHKRPPCASTIERQIDNPMPKPSGLVVKNASKTRSLFAGSIPPPHQRLLLVRALDRAVSANV